MKNKPWLVSNSFTCNDYTDYHELLSQKKLINKTISFVVPTLNEEKTIGKIVEILVNEKIAGLIDEVIVVDSHSSDSTIAIAKEKGADVYLSSEIKPETGYNKGKGENLWKSLFVSQSDIIFWVDGDILDFTNRFVHGLIGPLLYNPDIKYIKSMYKRPLIDRKQEVKNGGGRLTELLIKPLISVYFKGLSVFNQPLSGEYGGYREVFEDIDFPIGYGVEIALLIDIYSQYGIEAIGQVDMGHRRHRNRNLSELSSMAHDILPIFYNRCKKYNAVNDYNEKIVQRKSFYKTK